MEKGLWTIIIAIIGALAWLPQIIRWIYDAFTKPQVTFVIDRIGQVGFTTYGPIFNIRIAISCEHKAIVIYDMQIEIVHESGEKHLFGWQGIVNEFGTMAAEGKKMPIKTDQNAIAIKIGAAELVERFIRFQEIALLEKLEGLVSKAEDRLNMMQKECPDYHDKFLSSDEIVKLIEANKHAFCWKEGHYECTIISKSSHPFKVKDNKFSFTLSVANVDKLEMNSDSIRLDIEDVIKGNRSDFNLNNVIWQWVNPRLTKYGKSIKGEF